MSHLMITVMEDGEIVFSKNRIDKVFKVNGYLGEYIFHAKAFEGGVQLDDECVLGLKVFETTEQINFKKHEHEHLYFDKSLCMINKVFHNTKTTIRNFLKHILINYISGYVNFRINGSWFNEDINNLSKFIKNDTVVLKKLGFQVDIDGRRVQRTLAREQQTNRPHYKKTRNKRKQETAYIKYIKKIMRRK